MEASSGDVGVGADVSDVLEFLEEFPSLDSYFKEVMPVVMNAIKKSNGLPEAGDSFEYYSSFTSFRELINLESKRLLQLIQRILRHQSLKAISLGGAEELHETEDKFDALIEANDQLLERIGIFCDEAAGLRKKEAHIVFAEVNVTPEGTGVANTSTAASWNSAKQKFAAGLMGDSRSRSSSTFRLLAARSVDRPQLKFKDKVNNSRAPFIPRLTYKPNAVRPLQDSLSQIDDEYSGTFQIKHPYEYELQQLVYSTEQLEKCSSVPQMPLDLSSSSTVQFIDNESQLEPLIAALKQAKEIAVDLEHHSYRTYQGITCLMQLSTRQQDFIIDTLELRSQLYILNEVFTDPRIVKVFHGADSDIDWLQRDLGIYVVNMFDTHQASRALSLGRHSLSHLLHHYCNVHADKQYQLADWRIRPLPEELLRYAREDTHYLLYIYDRMRDELIERGQATASSNAIGLLRTVLEQSRRICTKVYVKPSFREDSYLELYSRSKKTFNSQQLQALAQLYSWRDETARAEDESTGYVLPNHMLLQIAETLPRETEGVLACCSTIPPLVKLHLNSLHRIMVEARLVPLHKAEAVRVEAAVKKAAQKQALLHCPHDTSGGEIVDNSSCSVVGALTLKQPTAVSLFSEVNVPVERSRMETLLHVQQSFVRLFDKYKPVKWIDFAVQTVVKKQREVVAAQTAVKRKSSEMSGTAPAEAAEVSQLDAHETAVAVEEGRMGSAPSHTADSKLVDELVQPLRKKSAPGSSKVKQVASRGSAESGHEGFLKPPENFHAYDYSKVDLGMFSEKPKKSGQKPKHGQKPRQKSPQQRDSGDTSTFRPNTSRPRTQLGHKMKSMSFKQRPQEHKH